MISDAQLPHCHSHPDVLPSLWDRAARLARLAFTPAEYEHMERWIQDLRVDDRMQAYRPALIHGDLACWNTLVDESASVVSGIVDFENTCIGDPAMDLMTSIGLGEEFYRELTRAYTQAGGDLGAHFEVRVRNLRVLRRLYGFVYFGEADDVLEFADHIRKLRESDLFRSTS